jgi:hypothetical protein
VLHDRTADKIAGYISQLPNANATIVPFPLGNRRKELVPWRSEQSTEDATLEALNPPTASRPSRLAGRSPLRQATVGPAPPDMFTQIAELRYRQRAKVKGRVRAVRVQPRAGVPSVECTLIDRTGQLLLVFPGRRRYPGVEPGAIVSAEGMVGERWQEIVMINPIVEILRPVETGEPDSGAGSEGQQD